ncbi:hypothetical protein EVAR_10772_1 [Eumeta japonica]|uniref:Uncharacterized protein n=1 Tax=Eumeta variegata TaxID=151549 RepID=A0A4C1W9I4_EUMVA|nr:hypothetical protein EVAR_10772_1 [Eumeta japonica]
MCIRPVMTYPGPVFAHAQPDALYNLQIVQNEFCRRAADSPRINTVEMRYLRSTCGVETCRSSDVREPCGLEEDVLTRVEEGVTMAWPFGKVE